MDISKNEEVPISIGKAAQILGVAVQTLRRWDEGGRLVAHKSSGGQRRYFPSELAKFSSSNSFKVAQLWATQKIPAQLESRVYCPTRAIFEARLQRFGTLLEESGVAEEKFSLIVSAAGEIGNNSFDHNLGNWPDVPGLFFDYDISSGDVVLADRGQGVLATLQRVRPSLSQHAEALHVAFTEVITGRAPEKRGNGLKYVKKVIKQGAASMTFQTGNAKLTMRSGTDQFNIEVIRDFVRGTLASFKFNVK